MAVFALAVIKDRKSEAEALGNGSPIEGIFSVEGLLKRPVQLASHAHVAPKTVGIGVRNGGIGQAKT